jgi:type IV pilus assembly protein PilC
MFGISRKQMIWLCHGMHSMLEAGLPVIRVLEVLAERAPGGLGRRLTDVRRRVEGGSSLAEAFAAAGPFPTTFLQLVETGEQSGTLDRTLGELHRYFEFQQRIWMRFLGQVTLPALQYVAAVAVVAITMVILNMLDGAPWPAGTILLFGYGGPVLLFALYQVVVRGLGATRFSHEIVLRLPVLGGVMESLALARFSLILHLMYEAGTPVREALRRALAGTGNAAFAARAERAVAAIERAGSLTDALLATGLFPREYTDIMVVAEQSGKVSERLDWMARHYGEKAESAMSALATALAWLIWIVVAGVIIFFIVKMFMRYLGAIQGAMP